MTIEDMFGDLKKIDILAEKSETNEVLIWSAMALLMVLLKRKKRCWIRWRDTLITHKVKYSK